MTKTEFDRLSRILKKLVNELCRQSTKRHDGELANNKKIKKILTEGLEDLDPGLRDIGQQFGNCCPHIGPPPQPRPKTERR